MAKPHSLYFDGRVLLLERVLAARQICHFALEEYQAELGRHLSPRDIALFYCVAQPYLVDAWLIISRIPVCYALDAHLLEHHNVWRNGIGLEYWIYCQIDKKRDRRMESGAGLGRHLTTH